MQVFDASSMIYAWDNYPLRQFPGLWDWIASQVDEEKLVMPIIAFGEVQHKAPDCGSWLKSKNLKQLEINNPIMSIAMSTKLLLGIIDDNYHPKGVDENDLLIIATAKVHNAELVSDEEKQTTLPLIPSKMKIPAVCCMTEVSLSCINFVEYIKRTNHIFR